MFEKFQSQNTEINELQQNVADAVNPLLRQALLDGILHRNVALTTSATNLSHLLGRKGIGFIVHSQSADARVWGGFVENLEDRLLSLTASAAVTVNIWVY